MRGNYLIRLPTERECEKAARGTDGRIFPWGNVYIPGFANIAETDDSSGPYWLRHSTAVGLYPQGASPYGALDMAGNVWEWTLTDGSGQDGNIRSDAARAVRGGSWSLSQGSARRVPGPRAS